MRVFSFWLSDDLYRPWDVVYKYRRESTCYEEIYTLYLALPQIGKLVLLSMVIGIVECCQANLRGQETANRLCIDSTVGFYARPYELQPSCLKRSLS